MNRAIAWFAENHVAANLLMMLLVVGGLLSILTIKQELMPEHISAFNRWFFLLSLRLFCSNNTSI